MNNSINHNYKIEAEVLSPLHIGAGSEKDWVKGLDFISDKGKLVKLNTRKMYEVFSNDIHKISNYFAKNKKADNELVKILGNKLDLVKEQEFDFNFDSKNSNDIKSFIKTGLNNKPYIPGSSLKGAIRSILVKHFLNGDKPTYKKFEKDYFGSPSDGDEFMRFVKISDAHFEKTNLINTKIFNLKSNKDNDFYGTWKPDYFNTVYEIIEQKRKSHIFTILLSKSQLKNFNSNAFYNKELKKADKIFDERNKRNKIKSIKTLQKLVNEKEKILSENLNLLFKIINQYTKEYIKREIDFFRKYSNNETQNIIDNLEGIKNLIPDDNSACVLRMSAGSGFHSVTGDWQHNSHDINGVFKRQGQLNDKKSAKSRKIAVSGENYLPMGFVKLSILTDEEIKQREQQEAERRNIELQKAEQRRIEREKQQQKQKQFNNLTTEADDLFKNKEYKKAIEKYNEAQEFDKNADLSSKIENCLTEIEKLEEQKRKDEERRKNEEFLKQKEAEELKRQQENKRKKELEKEKLLEDGLNLHKDLNDFNKGKEIVKEFYKAKNEQQIEGRNLQILKVFIENCIAKSNKRWKKTGDKDWKLVEKWVGKEIAQQWFNEIIGK